MILGRMIFPAKQADDISVRSLVPQEHLRWHGRRVSLHCDRYFAHPPDFEPRTALAPHLVDAGILGGGVRVQDVARAVRANRVAQFVMDFGDGWCITGNSVGHQ